MAMTWAPRARTSSRLECSLSETCERVATQTTGVSLVEQRDRTVLHLAAAYASVGM